MKTWILLIAVVGSVVTIVNQPGSAQIAAGTEERVTVENDGWHLIGDLNLPPGDGPLPAVLMLNKAAGDRAVYEHLGGQLAERSVASLRLDLRGHGESTNLGTFVPGEVPYSPLIWDSEVDVIAAIQFLKDHPRIDAHRIGVVGASYSGEEMAEAGRLAGYASAYVALSPGSFSDESIRGIDSSAVPWLFVISRDERHLVDIAAEVRRKSRTVEMLIVPGYGHATRLLDEYPSLAERIAVWLAGHLNMPKTPGARYGHEMAFDETRGETILFGGFGPDGRPKGDTWRWDGASWRFASISGPGPRRWPAMVYDANRKVVVLFGGRDGVGRDGQSLSDTWIWDGAAWTKAYVPGPLGRDHHRMTYDSDRGRVVLFGGWDGTQVVGDTWEWDGESWTEVATEGPAPRASFGLAYDPGLKATVLAGGQDLDQAFSDTWVWDGQTWVRHAVDGPSPRGFPAMTYDPVEGRVLLFGGRDQDQLRTDLWSWHGGEWTRLSETGPIRRGIFAAAYDPIRQNLIFHGSGDRVDDTWRLESSTWSWSDSLGWRQVSSP